jgi:hypothetical protein
MILQSPSTLGLGSARLPRVHRSSPQARGLVAWWPLSPCTGNIAPDAYGAGHGNAAELKWSVDPAFGAVPNFDGTQEARFSDAHLPAGASPRSLCAWVNFTGIPLCTAGVVFYGTNSFDHGLMIGTGNTSRWQPPGCLGMSQWGQELVTPRAYNDGTWHHLAATFDGVIWSVYVDGILENSKPLPTDTWPANGRIGSQNYMPIHRWIGLMRDVRIYDRTLAAAEIRLLFDPATRFDLWKPRWQPLAKPVAGAAFAMAASQVYVAGQLNGQIVHCGVAAGELAVAGSIIGEVK